MKFFFHLQVDCESTQRSVADPALGERALRGLGGVLARTGMKGTFVVIPSDIRAHAPLYRDLETQGHEIGLHLHPAEWGQGEFLGVYGYDEQVRGLRAAMDVFAQAMGHPPCCFTPGYFSANDHTFPALEAVGLTHGTVSCPTRDLPACACVWGHAPLDAHYPHRQNRCLTGDVDFVEVPLTVDTDSRLWGGAHPQDLRIELMDAKNHWYTIHKNVLRLKQAGETVPVKYIKALTHNTFEYDDPRNFRRETLEGVIAAVRRISAEQQCTLVPATVGEIASAYRRAVPRPAGGVRLELDTRGRPVPRAPGPHTLAQPEP